MEQLRALFSEAQAWFQRLSSRERVLVVIASGTVGAFAIFFILFSSAQSAATYRRHTEEKLLKLQEAQALAESFRESERARQEIENQLSTGALQLLSYIEEKGTAAGLEIPIMNTKGDLSLGDGKIIESSVELMFTDVNIRKLHDFLTNVERGPGVVKVKYLRLEPRPASETITAWTTIATYKLKQ